MIYKQFGNNNDVSILGLGTMRLPQKNNGKVDLNKSIPLIREAIDAGINYIDTAPGYNNNFNETVVGLALSEGYREKVYLSAKTNIGNSYDEWMKNFENTLRKLNVDYIDYHLFWCLAADNYKSSYFMKRGPIQAANDAKAQGLIKHLGFSSHDTDNNIRWIIDHGNFETVLLQYNLLDRSKEDTLQYAKSMGLSTAVMGPLAGGWLTNKIPLIDNIWKDNDELDTTELALQFVMSNSNVDILLSGIEDSEALKQTIYFTSHGAQLKASEIDHTNRIMNTHQSLSNFYCTGCNYCMPCQHGVAISRIFQLYNYYTVYGLKDYSKNKYHEIGTLWNPGVSNSSECTKCGLCEKKCPQGLPIIKKLEEAHKILL